MFQPLESLYSFTFSLLLLFLIALSYCAACDKRYRVNNNGSNDGNNQNWNIRAFEYNNNEALKDSQDNCWSHKADVASRQNVSFIDSGESKVERIFLRKKRFILFAKGSMATGVLSKSLVVDTPRGINIVYECTLQYPLPTLVEHLPWQVLEDRTTTSTKQPTTTSTVVAPTTPLTTPLWPISQNWQHFSGVSTASDWSGHNYSSDEAYEETEDPWRRQQNKAKKTEWIKSRHHYCSNNLRGFYRKQQKLYCESRKSKVTNKKRRFRRDYDPPHELNFKDDSERIFFDLIEHLSRLHGLNPRHCIMRALCETQHLLMPQGLSLFHDLVRILLSHALPALHRLPHTMNPLHKALYASGLEECAQRYGLHCRWGFFRQFTAAIHREFK